MRLAARLARGAARIVRCARHLGSAEAGRHRRQRSGVGGGAGRRGHGCVRAVAWQPGEEPRDTIDSDAVKIGSESVERVTRGGAMRWRS